MKELATVSGAVAKAPSGRWARLHPASPVVRFGRAAVALLVLLGSRAVVGQSDTSSRISDLAVLAIGLVASVTSWAVTRWRIVGGDLQIETGLLRRQSIRLPLVRLQAVDIVRPLLARALGLAEVRLVVAGSGSARSRLAYLRESQAEQVRAQLLALAHGLPEATPLAAERPLLSVDNGRLVASVALSGPTLALLLLVAALAGLLAAADPQTLAGAAGTLVTVGIGLATALFRRVNSEFSQTVAEAPDGLRLRGGLLQTRSETVPFRRLQALRWSEPLLWRPFGWSRLEFDVARQRQRRNTGDDNDNGAVARALLPVGTRGEAAWLLHGFMPAVSAASAWTSLPPARARVKAPLSYRHLGVWLDDRVVVLGSGRFGRQAVIVPLHKAQSFRLAQGPVSRRLHLATVHVDLVGRRWSTAARCRDETEARALLDLLVERARRARAAETTG